MSSLDQFITLLDPSAGQGFSVPFIKPCLGDGVGVCHQESNSVFTRLLISVVGSHSFHKCVIGVSTSPSLTFCPPREVLDIGCRK